MTRCPHRGPADRGDIVLGWLTRLVVILAVLGVVGFDLIALGAGRLQAEDHAQSATRAAVSSWAQTKNVQQAYEAALAQLVQDGDVGDKIAPAGFTVTPDGVVTLTLTHTSPTLLVDRIGPARQWATSTATVTGRPST